MQTVVVAWWGKMAARRSLLLILSVVQYCVADELIHVHAGCVSNTHTAHICVYSSWIRSGLYTILLHSHQCYQCGMRSCPPNPQRRNLAWASVLILSLWLHLNQNVRADSPDKLNVAKLFYIGIFPEQKRKKTVMKDTVQRRL